MGNVPAQSQTGSQVDEGESKMPSTASIGANKQRDTTTTPPPPAVVAKNLHVATFGDSILDNGNYVGTTQPDVATQLRALLQSRFAGKHRVTACATDGFVTQQALADIGRLPRDVTHILLSIGGNDGRHIMDTAASMPLPALAGIQAKFGQQYNQLLERLLAVCPKIIVVLPYHPRFGQASPLQSMAVAGISLYRDVMFRAAARRGLPIIDLALTFTEARDYANPIEPSAAGGHKIANLAVEAIASHTWPTAGSTAARTAVLFDASAHAVQEAKTAAASGSARLATMAALGLELDRRKAEFEELQTSLMMASIAPATTGIGGGGIDIAAARAKAQEFLFWIQGTRRDRMPPLDASSEGGASGGNWTPQELAARKDLMGRLNVAENMVFM